MPLKITNATMARVESSFKQLASAAQALNTASEDLSKVIRHLDASLKKLALGVTAWVPVSGTTDETQYWTNELGYAKNDGKWGLALREVTGFHLDNNDETEQIWGFNDAPRAQRAEAVEKIPDLLEKLLQQTQETTRDLREKIEQASEFTAVVADLTPSNAPAPPQQWQRPTLSPLPMEPTARKAAPDEPARPAPQRSREPESAAAERPAFAERPSGERPVAAAGPQPAAQFREGEAKPPAAAAVRPLPVGHAL